MSTWTSRGRAAALLLAAGLVLAACVLPAPPAGTDAAGKDAAGTGAAPGPRSLALQGGSFTAAAPQGYCIEPGASHDEGDSAVVLMGRCSGASSAAPALIALSIGAPGSSAVLQSGAQALSDYFLSPAGRAALARDGRASSVTIRKTAIADGVLILRVEDRSIGPYWRAVLGLKTRLVTLSVSAPEAGSAPEGPALDEATGRRILDRAVAALRRANTG